jgi:hypothetical protein
LSEEVNISSSLREIVYQCAGAATGVMMQDNPDYVFPSERVTESVELCLKSFFDISHLVNETDPRKWAEAFCQLTVVKPEIVHDVDMMFAWFANAMATQRDLDRKHIPGPRKAYVYGPGFGDPPPDVADTEITHHVD